MAKPRLTPSGTLNLSNDSGGVSVNPITQTVGVNTNVGGANVNAGVGPTGPQIGVGANVLNSGNVHVGIGAGIGAGGVGVTPTIQIGDSKGAATGAQAGSGVGSLAGAALGGPIGAAAGSTVGSAVGSIVGDTFLGNPRVQKETKQRDTVLDSFNDAGLFDDHTLPNADGSVWNFKENGEHDWKYGDKKVNDIGDRRLFAYETDYTNDLDYVSSMAGITLSRLFAGGKGKAIDQAGNALGNAFLGKNGYGNELTKETFQSTMDNARAAYAKAGVHTKEDFLSLTNTAYGQGRLNDSDHAVALQVAGLVFDNNFGLAQQLMAGRWDGLKTAGKTPQGADSQPSGRLQSPLISPQEALMSVKPYFDYIRETYPGAIRKPNKGLGMAATGASLVGGITAAAGLYNSVNKVTGGGLGDFIGDIGSGIRGVYDDVMSNASEERSDLGDGDFSFNVAPEPGVAPEVTDPGASDWTLSDNFSFDF